MGNVLRQTFARPPFGPGNFYSLTFCTSERRELFAIPTAAQLVVYALHRSAALGYCDQLAFVVMPNHVHWLIALTGKCPLGALVAVTKGEASRQLRRSCGLGLPIWQPGYYEHCVRANEDLKEQARYLIANPLRANLVMRLADYPFWFAIWASPPHGQMHAEALGEHLLER